MKTPPISRNRAPSSKPSSGGASIDMASTLNNWAGRSTSHHLRLGDPHHAEEQQADQIANAGTLLTGATPSTPRLHNDAQSHTAAAALNARAFTLGQDIYFGRGQYQPHTPAGRHLIAHEVAHTQQPGAEHTIRRKPLPGMENAPVDPSCISGILQNPAGAIDLCEGDPLLEAFQAVLAATTEAPKLRKIKRLMPQLYALHELLSYTSAEAQAPGMRGNPKSYTGLKIPYGFMAGLKSFHAAIHENLTMEAQVAKLVAARKAFKGVFQEWATLSMDLQGAAVPGIQHLKMLVQDQVILPFELTVQAFQLSRATVTLGYGLVAEGMVSAPGLASPPPQEVGPEPEPEADPLIARMLRYRQAAPKAFQVIQQLLQAHGTVQDFRRDSIKELQSGVLELQVAFVSGGFVESTKGYDQALRQLSGLRDWVNKLDAAMMAMEVLASAHHQFGKNTDTEIFAVLESATPSLASLSNPPSLRQLAQFMGKSSPLATGTASMMPSIALAGKWIKALTKPVKAATKLIKAEGADSAWEGVGWLPKGAADAKASGDFVGEDISRIHGLLGAGGLHGLVGTTYGQKKEPVPSLSKEAWDRVLGHLVRAIGFGRKGAEGKDRRNAAVAEALSIAAADNAPLREYLSSQFNQFVDRWMTPLSQAKFDRNRSKLQQALSPESSSRPLAEQIIASARTWPFGTEDFYDQVQDAFGGMDPLEHYADYLVRTKFFGHTLRVDKRLVEPLHRAEAYYVTEAARRGIPLDDYARVSPESGSHNFRASRSGEQAKMLKGKMDKENTHMMGWAVDINYGTNADPKNMQITNPKAWTVLKAVLRFAGRPDLAGIPFGEMWTNAQALSRWLGISKIFRESYLPWKAHMHRKVAHSLPGSPSQMAEKPSASHPDSALQLPPAEAYATWLKTQGIDIKSSENQSLLQRFQQARSRHESTKLDLGKKLTAIANKILPFADKLQAQSATPPLEGEKRSDALKVLWQKEVLDAVVASDDAQLLNVVDKVLKAIERLLQIHAVAGGSSREFPKADLVKRRDAIVKLSLKLKAVSASMHEQEANPALSQLVAASDDMAILKAHASTITFLESWHKHGLVDHEMLFLESMIKAGFTWGGIWPTPDFHHFEKQF